MAAKPPAQQGDAKSRMGTVATVSAAATNRVHPEPRVLNSPALLVQTYKY